MYIHIHSYKSFLETWSDADGVGHGHQRAMPDVGATALDIQTEAGKRRNKATGQRRFFSRERQQLHICLALCLLWILCYLRVLEFTLHSLWWVASRTLLRRGNIRLAWRLTVRNRSLHATGWVVYWPRAKVDFSKQPNMRIKWSWRLLPTKKNGRKTNPPSHGWVPQKPQVDVQLATLFAQRRQLNEGARQDVYVCCEPKPGCCNLRQLGQLAKTTRVFDDLFG